MRVLRLLSLGAVSLFFAAFLLACGTPDPTPTPTPRATPTAAPAAPGETPTPEPQREAWQDEWDQTVAMAQQEGRLEIIGGSAAVIYRPVFDRFGQTFNIRVSSSGGSSRELVDRVLAERQAGRYTVDHFLAGLGTSTERLIPNNVLGVIADQFILPEVTDQSLWFGGRHWYADPDQRYVFSFSAEASISDLSTRYNTDLVAQEEYDSITSMWDFIDPRWNGRIVAQPPTDPAATGTYNIVYFHPDLGPRWLEEFFKMDVRWMTDQRLIADQLLLGRFAVCIFCSGVTDQLDQLRGEGAPIADFLDKGDDPRWSDAIVLSGTSSGSIMSIIAQPAHPAAAKVFVNWVLSKEGQTAIHTLTTDRNPAPTLREDVTEMGNTDSRDRRRPGVQYVFLEEQPNYNPQTSLEESRRIFEATR